MNWQERFAPHFEDDDGTKPAAPEEPKVEDYVDTSDEDIAAIEKIESQGSIASLQAQIAELKMQLAEDKPARGASKDEVDEYEDYSKKIFKKLETLEARMDRREREAHEVSRQNSIRSQASEMEAAAAEHIKASYGNRGIFAGDRGQKALSKVIRTVSSGIRQMVLNGTPAEKITKHHVNLMVKDEYDYYEQLFAPTPAESAKEAEDQKRLNDSTTEVGSGSSPAHGDDRPQPGITDPDFWKQRKERGIAAIRKMQARRA